MEYKQFTGTSENIGELSDWLNVEIKVNFNKPESPVLSFSYLQPDNTVSYFSVSLNSWLLKDSNNNLITVLKEHIDFYINQEFLIVRSLFDNDYLYKFYVIKNNENIAKSLIDLDTVKKECVNLFMSRITSDVPLSIKFILDEDSNKSYEYKHTDWKSEYEGLSEGDLYMELTVKRFRKFLSFLLSIH